MSQWKDWADDLDPDDVLHLMHKTLDDATEWFDESLLFTISSRFIVKQMDPDLAERLKNCEDKVFDKIVENVIEGRDDVDEVRRVLGIGDNIVIWLYSDYLRDKDDYYERAYEFFHSPPY